MDFKIGDTVDVIDLRDGAVVERGAVVKALNVEALPDIGERTLATLSTGYAVTTRCLRPAQETTNG